MKLIKDLGMSFPNKDSKYKRRYGIYECPKCFVHFKVSITHAKSGIINMCKLCKQKNKLKKHGGKGTRLYSIWEQMKSRCNNPQHKSYSYYGGRGIRVNNKWEESFISFRKWAFDNGYDDNLTIDRINNEGNYEPSNCRWSSRVLQSQNTRKNRTNNTSGYRGVNFHKSSKRWEAKIQVNGKRVYLGKFATPLDGAIAYDKYIKQNKLNHTSNGVYNEK